MSDGLMSIAEWKEEKERRARLLEGLDDSGREAMEAEWRKGDQEKSTVVIEKAKEIAAEEAKEIAAIAAEMKRHRYEYKVVRIERDSRLDSTVSKEAETTINTYAQEGWRLHTYSQVALSSGSMGPIVGNPLTNALHLVFERER